CSSSGETVYFSTEDVLLINAHNKQTVHLVIQLLKLANIPCCGILDIDVLNSKDDLNNLLDSLGQENLSLTQISVLDSLAKEVA
ncbi:hypothetical protein OFC55_38880, partial [Escherichia coli]|nr:hypothetical protein [Escherichia coli]